MAKPIFEYKKSFFRTYWNNFGYQARIFSGLAALIFITSIPSIRDGIKNAQMYELKEKWIKECVRNTKNEFSHLDREDPPQPLKPRTYMEQFRQEFSQMTKS